MSLMQSYSNQLSNILSIFERGQIEKRREYDFEEKYRRIGELEDI